MPRAVSFPFSSRTAIVNKLGPCLAGFLVVVSLGHVGRDTVAAVPQQARFVGVTPGAISVHVDEDVSNDTERAHITETVSVIAFAEPFQWRPFPDLTLATSLIAISDPTGTGDPKSLPGAVLEYQVQVNNTGRGSSDSDSVQIEDAVPAGTSFFPARTPP